MTKLCFIGHFGGDESFREGQTIKTQNDADALADILLNRSYTPPNDETISHYRENFSLSKFAEAHLQLYNQIVGGI